MLKTPIAIRALIWLKRAGLSHLLGSILAFQGTAQCRPADTSLHDDTVARLIGDLASPDPSISSAAAEKLGYLRAYNAADSLAAITTNDSVEVRREACLSLAWCGNRSQIPILIRALEDSDWSVRQAAWVSLTNLSGMEFGFDSHAPPETRAPQCELWREWWKSLPDDEAPPILLDQLESPSQDLAQNRVVTVSSLYKGPASVLSHPAEQGFWQTKNVPFPQHATVDLGKKRAIGRMVVTQYGPGYRMTDYSVSVSNDGLVFRELFRKKEKTPTDLTVRIPDTFARFVRITSHASENSLYPTTIHRINLYENASREHNSDSPLLINERAMRALGCLGGKGASQGVAEVLQPYLTRKTTGREEKLMLQAGIRALGRLRDADNSPLLRQFLTHPQWARYAADALGDIDSPASVRALIDAYPTFAANLSRKPPAVIPSDDRPGFEAVDRMYETAHAISLALSRFTFENEDLHRKLRKIAPLLVSNMAGDFDGAMLYEEQAYQKITSYLLEQSGIRGAIREIAFEALGFSADTRMIETIPEPARTRLRTLAASGPGGTSFAAGWLAAICRDKSDIPRLHTLLDHENGWVRINAAKALIFINDSSVADSIASRLEASKTEAEFGLCTDFLFKKAAQGQDEYNAPSPCWREAFTRALGHLGGPQHVPLLIGLLNDERNVLEVRYAAADSLVRIGNPEATASLTAAASSHPFHSIRLLAREALWKRGLTWPTPVPEVAATERPCPPSSSNESEEPSAIIFIQGSNDMPNDFQIDIWRQTYSTTDSGPTYRLGSNIYQLKPARPNGTVSPITRFEGGYVADCEVSWNGRHVVFARRDAHNPWWHIWEADLQGGAPKQLTSGPYHDVQPAYLADGRIVFSSSRTGLRDEYHGYPATGLTVMNRDGSDIHCIGFNLGRDNEPAIMPDGRIVFSRLELFYSRLKTELTLQSMFPDGTMNRTLYGPERRSFWRDQTKQSGEKFWGESAPRHRVLRLTQPQPIDHQRVIVSTTGGATITGPGSQREYILPRHANMAITSPFPLDDKRALCAATVRTQKRNEVDLGIYQIDLKTGALTLVFNDPDHAEFEARPVMRRAIPRQTRLGKRSNEFTARLLCGSIRTTREPITRQRGKLLRIVEGQPVPSRHHTHTSSAGQAWKNHVGTHARVLGTVPLASDGSFHVEIPADRLVHCQVLDSDRRVVGNQMIWMSARPGEVRSCVGCHESADSAAVSLNSIMPVSARYPALSCLPTGNEFSYRAKAWQKGALSEESEERTRTVNAVNLPARN